MRKEKLEEFGRRVTAKLRDQEKTVQQFAAEIEKSYEMARRYARGWALPDDPKTLELIARSLHTSVGELLAGEQDTKALPPLIPAKELTEPITYSVRMLIEDEAMTTMVDNIRLFGMGDQVILYPRKPMPGDIVAIRARETTTLRKMIDREGILYSPRNEGYATYSTGTLIGVVAGVHGVAPRFE